VGELTAHYRPTQGHLSSTLEVCVLLVIYSALTFAYHLTVLFLFLPMLEGWVLVICVFWNLVKFRR
jgi:hypothetical protein